MKICLIGDFNSFNGPANANKAILQALTNNTFFDVSFSHCNTKATRIVEMLKMVIASETVFICSKSQLNVLTIKLAKLLNKKIIYLVHGISSYEYKINAVEFDEDRLNTLIKYECYCFSNVDKIICVSKKTIDKISEIYPQYNSKYDYINNIVDICSIKRLNEYNANRKNENKVISVGGGMKQKNNLLVAKAINRMDQPVPYVVVGPELEEGERIKAFSNIIWIDSLRHDELIKLMNSSNLYVQNSVFETFGLSIIEALAAGCSILVSNNVGCIDLFNNISQTDIIYDVNDVCEISQKIQFLLKHENNTRLMEGLDVFSISPEFVSNKIKEIIESI